MSTGKSKPNKGAAAAAADDGKLNPEDLVEALLDQRVLEALKKAMTPLTQALEQSLTKRLDAMATTLRMMREETGRLTEQCNILAAENIDLKRRVENSELRVDELERYSRCDNLIIRGLPESTAAERASDAPASTDDGATLRNGHKSVETNVISFIRDTLRVDVTPADISTAHRLKAGPNDTSRPVIVRFTNRRVRNEVYSARKMLRGSTSRVFVSEHLTKSDADLFYDARKLLKEKKIFAAWTQNGLVNVRFSPDQNTRPTVVHNRADLALRP